jgi:hypothetical protein
MPRLLPIENPNSTPTLLALRRTLWQLATLCAASAVAILAFDDAPGTLPVWLLLMPTTALFVHHRAALLALIRRAAEGERDTSNPGRRPLRRQANQRIEPMSRRRPSRQPHPIQQAR